MNSLAKTILISVVVSVIASIVISIVTSYISFDKLMKKEEIEN